MDEPVAWVDGSLCPLGDAQLRADDAAYTSGLGCYTTARVCAGRIRHREQVVQRLVRDARNLGIGEVDGAEAARGIVALADAWFGDAEGIVRMQASRDGTGALRLVGLARPVGPEPEVWRATISDVPHPGPQGAGGAKLSGRPALTLAGARAREAGADEALLVDPAGFLVEGARSNLIVVAADGTAGTPALALGGVAGVALQIVQAELSLPEREILRAELAAARELIALNSVRGARPILAVDARPVGEGVPGTWAARLAEILHAAA